MIYIDERLHDSISIFYTETAATNIAGDEDSDTSSDSSGGVEGVLNMQKLSLNFHLSLLASESTFPNGSGDLNGKQCKKKITL